jgi:hypothetical protein
MQYVGIDWAYRRAAWCAKQADGAIFGEGFVPADEDGLARLVIALGSEVRACLEMMSGAAWVRDRLAGAGWRVEVADARKVKSVAPLACKTDSSQDRDVMSVAPGTPHRFWNAGQGQARFLCEVRPRTRVRVADRDDVDARGRGANEPEGDPEPAPARGDRAIALRHRAPAVPAGVTAAGRARDRRAARPTAQPPGQGRRRAPAWAGREEQARESAGLPKLTGSAPAGSALLPCA